MGAKQKNYSIFFIAILILLLGCLGVPTVGKDGKSTTAGELGSAGGEDSIAAIPEEPGPAAGNENIPAIPREHSPTKAAVDIGGETVSDANAQWSQTIKISAEITNDTGLDGVWVNVETGIGTDIEDMAFVSGSIWEADYTVREEAAQIFNYTVYANDTSGNVYNGTTNSFSTYNEGPYFLKDQMDAQGIQMWSESFDDAGWVPELVAPETIDVIIKNISSNGWPTFHDAQAAFFMLNENNRNSLKLHLVGVFDGIKYLDGLDMTAHVELVYYPVSYQTGEYNQMWNSDPYLDGDKLHLFTGSGNMIQNSIRITDSNPDTNKFVGFGNLTGVYDLQSSTNETDFYCGVDGVGYANFYAQYAPDGYDDTAFIDTYSHCEHLRLNTKASPSRNEWSSLFIGVLEGAKPLPIAFSSINELYSLEYMPVSYQTGTYDQKWVVEPSFDSNTLYLLRGAGNVKKADVKFEDNNPDTNKIVGFGEGVGVFEANANITNDAIQFGITGVGALMNASGSWPDYTGGLGIQYAPDGFENTAFVDGYSHCEHLRLNTKASPDKSEWSSLFIGVLEGAKPLPFPGIDINESFELEYMPVWLLNTTFDSKWFVSPFGQDNNMAIISNGSGHIKISELSIADSNPSTGEITGISGVYGPSDFYSSIHTDNLTWLNADIHSSTGAVNGTTGLYIAYGD
jgi:hypothetical protein